MIIYHFIIGNVQKASEQNVEVVWENEGLLSRNYFKFRLVKAIIRKIAYKSIITTKNVYFLRMVHHNVVREIYQRSQGMYCASETCLNRSESSIAPTPE